MESQKSTLFVINAGSSSIKFSVYKSEPLLVELLSGEIANIGSSEAKLSVTKNNKKEVFDSQSTSYYQAACAVIDLLEKQVSIDSVIAIGHRVVHGLKRFEPEYITPQLLVELKNIQVLDPEHLPNEIMLIELFCKQFPNAAHIACFDTFFHASMPRVAKLLSIPRRFFEKGVQRYGFHGISYAYR